MLYNYIFHLLWLWVANSHPFYVSLTDIRYNPEHDRLEMAQRIFWDDLEVALSQQYQKKVDFLNPDDPQELEKFIEAYLLEKNEIHINGGKVTLKYLGHEIEEDTAWFYLEGSIAATPEKARIKNSVLIHVYDTQQNIVNFYLEKSPRSLITSKDKEWGELVL
jgi:hypothetical protein